jgi:hypothetical protein
MPVNKYRRFKNFIGKSYSYIFFIMMPYRSLEEKGPLFVLFNPDYSARDVEDILFVESGWRAETSRCTRLSKDLPV